MEEAEGRMVVEENNDDDDEQSTPLPPPPPPRKKRRKVCKILLALYIVCILQEQQQQQQQQNFTEAAVEESPIKKAKAKGTTRRISSEGTVCNRNIRNNRQLVHFIPVAGNAQPIFLFLLPPPVPRCGSCGGDSATDGPLH